MTDKPMPLRWRLRVMMSERGITTVTELGRRLQRLGVTMSSQQLNRIVTEMPQRLNTELLAALLTVLSCRVEDLIQIEEPAAEPTADPAPSSDARAADRPPARARTPRRRPAKQVDSGEPIDDVTGPTVTPFPIQSRR